MSWMYLRPLNFNFFCLWLVTSLISTTWVYCTTAVVDGTQDWLFKKIKWMYQGFMLVFSWIWKDMHLRPLQLLGDNCHTNVVTLYICWWSHSCVCFILQCPYWLVSSAGRIKYRGVSAVSHSNRCALGICNAIWRSWMCLIDAKIFQPMTVPSS